MKPRQGSAPDLVRGTRSERPRTEEFGAAADGNDRDKDDARPRPIRNPMQTAEIDVARDRRVTLTSPIPAFMAESMSPPAPERSMQARDPAAPEPERFERTRRIGDSDPVRAGSGPTPKSEQGVAPWRHRAAQRIDEARAALDAGDVTAAVTAAEAALRQADEAPEPGIVEVIEPARPLLTRVFATYVGPSTGVPILAPRADDIARQRLGERERTMLRRIDGNRTLEELFDGSGLGSTDALRMVARLIRSGAVRIV
jgi:hypothetical protein